MRNKIVFFISEIVMIAALVFMFINAGFYSFPDWAVRADGVIILIGIPVVTYNTVKLIRLRKNG